MGGMAQMARFRQPGAAAIAFMNTLAATEARFSARARSARRPCRASAMPRQAKTSAAGWGMAATRAATAGGWRAAPGAAIRDAAALVFACLGITLALHGRRALRAQA